MKRISIPDKEVSKRIKLLTYETELIRVREQEDRKRQEKEENLDESS